MQKTNNISCDSNFQWFIIWFWLMNIINWNWIVINFIFHVGYRATEGGQKDNTIKEPDQETRMRTISWESFSSFLFVKMVNY